MATQHGTRKPLGGPAGLHAAHVGGSFRLMNDTLIIPIGFNGPRLSGNGGYVAGRLATKFTEKFGGDGTVDVGGLAARDLGQHPRVDRRNAIEARAIGGGAAMDGNAYGGFANAGYNVPGGFGTAPTQNWGAGGSYWPGKSNGGANSWYKPAGAKVQNGGAWW